MQAIALECRRQHPTWHVRWGGAACEDMYSNMRAEMSCIQNYDALNGHPDWHEGTADLRRDGLERLGNGNLTDSSLTKLQNSKDLYKRMLDTAGRRLPSNGPPMLLSSGGAR